MEVSYNEEPKKCGLLALLPKPKNALNNKTTALLIPAAVAKGSTVSIARKRGSNKSPSIESKQSKPQIVASVKSLVTYGSSSDEEDEKDEKAIESSRNAIEDSKIDFFGITSSKFDVEPIPVAIVKSVQENVFIGPEKTPNKNTLAKKSFFNFFYSKDEEKSLASTADFITQQDAMKMIYEKELAPYGGSMIMAADAVNNIIDVNVDRALGPNVRENLLKNINNKAMAQVATGPLPKVKKDPKERLAKQKHQITHLAGLAVAREEMLQETWADNKQKKRASARRYGF